MRRIISLALSLVMLLPLCFTAVSAANKDFVTVYTSCDREYYNAGNIIGITLSLRDITLDDGDGISVFSFKLGYDSSLVTLVTEGDSDGEYVFDYTSLMTSCPDGWEGIGRNNTQRGTLDLAFEATGASVSSMNTVTGDDELVISIRFAVNSDAKAEDLIFSFDYVEAYNSDLMEYCKIDVADICVKYALQPDTLTPLPETAMPLDIAGYADGAETVVYYADTETTIADYLAFFDAEGGLADYAVAIASADGVISYCDASSSDKSSIVIPAGSFIIAVSADSACYDRFVSEVEPLNIINLYNLHAEGADVTEAVIPTDAGFDVTDVPDIPTSKLKFNGASLTLYNDLTINFKADKALFTEVGYTDPYAVFVLDGVETVVTEYSVVSGRYVFDFSNLAPHQIGDTVYATLYATYDGVLYEGETREYSIKEYCYNTLHNYSSDTYAVLRTLLVDLLNYGTESQKYMSHNVSMPVNGNLTSEQKAWGTVTEREYVNLLDRTYATIESPSVVWKGAGLNLVDSVEMRFKLDAESVDGLTVKVKSDIGEWVISSSEFVPSDDGYYYAFFDGFNVAEMGEAVYVTVYNGKTAVSNTLRYSIESYAYTNQNSTYLNLADLLRSMISYGDSAKAYINQ